GVTGHGSLAVHRSRGLSVRGGGDSLPPPSGGTRPRKLRFHEPAWSLGSARLDRALGEPVSDAAHRLDVAPRGAELAPDALDVCGVWPLAARLPPGREAIDQRAPAHDAARLCDQRREQLALARREFDAASVGDHPTRAGIELYRTDRGRNWRNLIGVRCEPA